MSHAGWLRRRDDDGLQPSLRRWPGGSHAHRTDRRHRRRARGSDRRHDRRLFGRKHVQARRPRFEHDPQLRAQVAEEFLAAATSGEVDALPTLLAPDVSLNFDGGGKASAGLRPVHGPDGVIRYVQGVAKAAPELDLAVRWLNGNPGLIAQRADGSVDAAFVLDVADGVITRINVIRNPDKLTHLAGPSDAR